VDKLVPVWDHVRDVFLFWAVWKVLDLTWLHCKCDDQVTRLLSKKSLLNRLVKMLETTVI
jgi:hypothetical protein